MGAAFIVDIIEEIFLMLAGVVPIYRAPVEIPIIGPDGTVPDIPTQEFQGDLIRTLIQSQVVQTIFASLIAIATALLIFFTILQLIRNQYKEKDGGNPYTTVFRMIKGMVLFMFITAAVMVGLQVSGIVLNALNSATAHGTPTSVSGMIFGTKSWSANRGRYVPADGVNFTQMNEDLFTQIMGNVETVEQNVFWAANMVEIDAMQAGVPESGRHFGLVRMRSEASGSNEAIQNWRLYLYNFERVERFVRTENESHRFIIVSVPRYELVNMGTPSEPNYVQTRVYRNEWQPLSTVVLSVEEETSLGIIYSGWREYSHIPNNDHRLYLRSTPPIGSVMNRSAASIEDFLGWRWSYTQYTFETDELLRASMFGTWTGTHNYNRTSIFSNMIESNERLNSVLHSNELKQDVFHVMSNSDSPPVPIPPRETRTRAADLPILPNPENYPVGHVSDSFSVPFLVHRYVGVSTAIGTPVPTTTVVNRLNNANSPPFFPGPNASRRTYMDVLNRAFNPLQFVAGSGLMAEFVLLGNPIYRHVMNEISRPIDQGGQGRPEASITNEDVAAWIDRTMIGRDRHYILFRAPRGATVQSVLNNQHEVALISGLSFREIGAVLSLYSIWSMSNMIGWLGIFIAIGVLLNFAFGLVQRLIEMLVLYMLSPLTIAFYPFDDGQSFNNNFVRPFYKKTIAIFAPLLAMNLFFILIPPIRSIQFFPGGPSNFFPNLMASTIVTLALLSMLPAIRSQIMSMLGADSMQEKKAGSVWRDSMTAVLGGAVGGKIASGKALTGTVKTGAKYTNRARVGRNLNKGAKMDIRNKEEAYDKAVKGRIGDGADDMYKTQEEKDQAVYDAKKSLDSAKKETRGVAGYMIAGEGSWIDTKVKDKVRYFGATNLNKEMDETVKTRDERLKVKMEGIGDTHKQVGRIKDNMSNENLLKEKTDLRDGLENTRAIDVSAMLNDKETGKDTKRKVDTFRNAVFGKNSGVSDEDVAQYMVHKANGNEEGAGKLLGLINSRREKDKKPPLPIPNENVIQRELKGVEAIINGRIKIDKDSLDKDIKDLKAKTEGQGEKQMMALGLDEKKFEKLKGHLAKNEYAEVDKMVAKDIKMEALWIDKTSKIDERRAAKMGNEVVYEWFKDAKAQSENMDQRTLEDTIRDDGFIELTKRHNKDMKKVFEDVLKYVSAARSGDYAAMQKMEKDNNFQEGRLIQVAAAKGPDGVKNRDELIKFLEKMTQVGNASGGMYGDTMEATRNQMAKMMNIVFSEMAADKYKAAAQMAGGFEERNLTATDNHINQFKELLNVQNAGLQQILKDSKIDIAGLSKETFDGHKDALKELQKTIEVASRDGRISGSETELTAIRANAADITKAFKTWEEAARYADEYRNFGALDTYMRAPDEMSRMYMRPKSE